MPVINAHRQRAVIVEAVDPAPDRLHELAAIRIDYTDPAALYLSLHWLADRGHLCGWMLPTTHGGRVEAWDGLSAWEVAAVLVSVSVGRVARGMGPVSRVLGAYQDWDITKTTRRGTRNYGRGGCKRDGLTSPTVIHISDDRWFYGGGHVTTAGGGRSYAEHPDVASWEAYARALADDTALTDGCCLLVPGGLVVPA
jgi:hypothetical protein